jgi:hypothetical protein
VADNDGRENLSRAGGRSRPWVVRLTFHQSWILNPIVKSGLMTSMVGAKCAALTKEYCERRHSGANVVGIVMASAGLPARDTERDDGLIVTFSSTGSGAFP